MADVLARKHGLNERQSLALRFLLEHGKMTIQDFEAQCPNANRRTLQRDLKALVDKEMLQDRGTAATDPNRVYSRGPSLENREL